ncbi:MAG: hypothetical protein KAR03_07995, partial [Candidatus Thorarchaeota archaeon]|nr:hypothetical protein [Candidatus Thorarchaeota archaeon]
FITRNLLGKRGVVLSEYITKNRVKIINPLAHSRRMIGLFSIIRMKNNPAIDKRIKKSLNTTLGSVFLR